MFKGVRNLWKEARADVIRREVEDLFNRYSGYGWYERYELLSAFIYLKDDLEMEHGVILEWPQEKKSTIVKQLMQAAKQGFETAPYGTSGMALLGMYIDVQTVPGENAIRLKNEVEEWYQAAIQTDLDSPHS